ncbi:hypothetical protein BH695_0888 [Microcystis aeruginosa PCC 7806SL]|uniref:Uncharacterized protein n=2 Tax=Microcystis TaxID=1125 RepID=A0A0K1S430_9CHRO|nr:hypothetical protein VL20_3953 [Microcystis panniformis FACHB-1757]ARI80169.1 hypothetical protein BH695_0888 [Microcystis aeruginosa PCC 7806SL]
MPVWVVFPNFFPGSFPPIENHSRSDLFIFRSLSVIES